MSIEDTPQVLVGNPNIVSNKIFKQSIRWIQINKEIKNPKSAITKNLSNDCLLDRFYSVVYYGSTAILLPNFFCKYTKKIINI